MKKVGIIFLFSVFYMMSHVFWSGIWAGTYEMNGSFAFLEGFEEGLKFSKYNLFEVFTNFF